MENSLDNNLMRLKTEFAKMCRIAESMLEEANALLIKADKEKALEVVKKDKLVDDAEMDIEHGCMRLLLRNQPFAKDFRDISCLLKAITDVERIGDQSADIAGIVPCLSGKVKIKSIIDMGKLAVEMVRSSCSSLINEDIELAEKTQVLDDDMDRLFDKALGEIVDVIKESSEHAREVAELLMIAKYYERIGDHAVNICEWTQFGNTGIHKKTQ